MSGKFYKCTCNNEGLWVEYDGYGITKFAFFHRSPENQSWSNRIKLAWNCLKGNPYADMVLLDEQSIADLVDQLVDIQNLI